MTVEGIRKAVDEARRFIRAAEIVTKGKVETDFALFGSAASGACRRSSLDLTRELARMRRGR